jgi:hypothetical protein
MKACSLTLCHSGIALLSWTNELVRMSIFSIIWAFVVFSAEPQLQNWNNVPQPSIHRPGTAAQAAEGVKSIGDNYSLPAGMSHTVSMEIPICYARLPEAKGPDLFDE